ncbi:toprim domain-containing protein [Pedobacter sp. WC2423]|uniref:toprim domain-containing protein n=1 Tax=Pedobacter sp. WC2423 TaxID=3234142 RepID=UPI0034672093
MESKNGISLQEIKEIDLVSYLGSLGIEPVKIRGNIFWYLSPFREEKTPSFKIDRQKNVWVDFGERSSSGKFSGGTIIDFAMQFHDCTIGEFLACFNQSSFPPQKQKHFAVFKEDPASKILVSFEKSLYSNALLQYLKKRRISVAIADIYCKEIHYEVNGKNYFGIGFKNDSGGFEIRNPYAKISSAPKDITTLENGADEVIVFEGFIDFLSYLSVQENLPGSKYDYVILNGVSLFERARPFLEKHQGIHLFLDRDKTGKECTLYAHSLSEKYIDESNLYKNHKDFNDWLTNFGNSS